MESAREFSTVFIQLLGEFRVTVADHTSDSIKFRSRTAERLLVSLALRVGHAILKSEVLESLWPDSDGDRQAQNLRKAVSDVRQALGNSNLVGTDGDRIWLDADYVQTDVHRFRQLTDAGLSGNDQESNLREAIALYQGELLVSHSEPWMQVHRMELEERFGQAVEQLIARLLQSEKHDEALRIGRHAVTVSPLREDIHIALTRAYASAGLRSEAIRQYEELEALLLEQWGEPPSPRSAAAFSGIWSDEVSQRPPFVSSAGGAVSASSPFYIERECDLLLAAAVKRGEGTILIHGPRQVGKTSLLSGVLGKSKSERCRVVITDFQVFSRSQLADADSFFKVLAYGFAAQLGVALDIQGLWNEWIGPNSNLHTAIENVLLRVDGPIVWAMDEADRLFGTDFADDFFGLIRSWYNLRAMDESGPFSRLSTLIAYATEAHLFIQDLNQSPFNVGVRIPVRDFSLEQTMDLARRYGMSAVTPDIRKIWEIAGGQPFLTRKALDALVHEGVSIEHLSSDAGSEDGPFGEHMRRMLHVIDRDDETKSEITRFMNNKPFMNPKTPLRLMAGGLLVRKGQGEYGFRVPAYRDLLRRYS